MIKNPDRDFNKIYKKFKSRIFNYLRRSCNEDLAEEITQETFIKVNNSLKDLKDNSKITTWLYKIATNTLIDKLRTQSFKSINKEKISIDEIEQFEVYKDIWDKSKKYTIEQEIIKKEMIDCISQFIDNLTERYRTIVILSEFERLKDKEISKILNISIENVKIRLNRAKKQLRLDFSNNCEFYYDEYNDLSCELNKKK